MSDPLTQARDRIAELEADNAALREELAEAERRRGGECDTCGGWVCPPLRCAACMMTKRITPDSDTGPLAADVIRQQDKELAALREAVRVLSNECDTWRTHTEENYYTNAMRACRKTDANPLAAAAVREAKEQA